MMKTEPEIKAEPVITDEPVLYRELETVSDKRVGIATLNSQKTHNALSLAMIESLLAAAMNSASSIRSTTESTRRPIRSIVKPSGKVTLVYVCAGGVRNRASTLPMWSSGRIW